MESEGLESILGDGGSPGPAGEDTSPPPTPASPAEPAVVVAPEADLAAASPFAPAAPTVEQPRAPAAAAQPPGVPADKPAEAAKAAPSFREDPEGFLDHRLERFGEALIRQWEHRQQVGRINASEAAAKARHADFDEKAAEFAKQVELNPALLQELARAENPGEFAYERGRQALEIAAAGGLDELKARLRAEWEAELREPVRPAAPVTTATQRSVAPRSGPGWAGPKAIGDLLPPLA